MRKEIIDILLNNITDDLEFNSVSSYIEDLLFKLSEYESTVSVIKASIEPMVRLNDSLQIQNTQYVDKLNDIESSNLSRIANAVEIIAKTNVRKNKMIKDHIIT
jgi:regulator of replication initiation timing